LSNAGAYDNDENTLIIHDRDLARAYYEEWQRLWATVPEERVCNVFEELLTKFGISQTFGRAILNLFSIGTQIDRPK
jgi:phosphatidylserine/phosphatidylglycerophosphate/cardiolipin synthase-like enzyme